MSRTIQRRRNNKLTPFPNLRVNSVFLLPSQTLVLTFDSRVLPVTGSTKSRLNHSFNESKIKTMSKLQLSALKNTPYPPLACEQYIFHCYFSFAYLITVCHLSVSQYAYCSFRLVRFTYLRCCFQFVLSLSLSLSLATLALDEYVSDELASGSRTKNA